MAQQKYSEIDSATIDMLEARSQASETYTSDDTKSLAFSDSINVTTTALSEQWPHKSKVPKHQKEEEKTKIEETCKC